MLLDLVALDFETYRQSVPLVMELAGARAALSGQTAILLKPNLVNAAAPPVTTDPALCAAVIRHIRSFSDVPVVIAEGSGDATLETPAVFDRLGYAELAADLNVELVDLNHAPLKRLVDPECEVFPEIHLPEIAFSHYIISLPVLKAHSLAGMTGTLKNMIGFAPPRYYAGKGGTWKKAMFHERMHRAIVELNRYRTPDFTLMDASVGLAEHHLGGPACDPPVGKLIAGCDALEIDRTAAGLLGIDWTAIPCLGNELNRGRWVSFWSAGKNLDPA